MSVRVISIFSSKLYREYFLISKQISRYKISEKEISLEETAYLLAFRNIMSVRVILPFSGKIVSRTFFKISTMKIYYVYILKCSDKTYYTGFTSDFEKRFFEHQQGKHQESYTYKRRPLELVFYCEFTVAGFAIDTEKKIKKWSKAKKEALINDEFEKLPNLAKKKFK